MRERLIRSPFVVNIQGVKILFSTEDSYSRCLLYIRCSRGRLHEENATNLLVENLKFSRCFVDVGAHLGYYTFLAAKLMPAGIVYAFEMDEHNYALLAKNLQVNECENVHIFHEAVTDSSGIVCYGRTFRQPNPTLSFSPRRLQAKHGRVLSVQAVTLDDFFNDKKVIPDVVKIDVEGAEMKVLNGMNNILEKRDIILFVEVHPIRLRLKFQSSANSVVLTLLDKGYSVFEIKNFRRHGKDINLRKLHKDSQLIYNTMLYAFK